MSFFFADEKAEAHTYARRTKETTKRRGHTPAQEKGPTTPTTTTQGERSRLAELTQGMPTAEHALESRPLSHVR